MRKAKEKVIYNQSQFNKALGTLREAVCEKDVNQYVRDATIKRFEYTYETTWKLIKAVLSFKGVDLSFPKDMFREAFSVGWIKKVEPWEDMIEDRNLTSHTYKSRTAEDVYTSILTVYYQELKDLQIALNEVITNDITNS